MNSTKRNKSVQSYNSFYKDSGRSSSYTKPDNLPDLKPIKQKYRNKSVLDQILTRQEDFSKAYFH